MGKTNPNSSASSNKTSSSSTNKTSNSSTNKTSNSSTNKTSNSSTNKTSSSSTNKTSSSSTNKASSSSTNKTSSSSTNKASSSSTSTRPNGSSTQQRTSSSSTRQRTSSSSTSTRPNGSSTQQRTSSSSTRQRTSSSSIPQRTSSSLTQQRTNSNSSSSMNRTGNSSYQRTYQTTSQSGTTSSKYNKNSNYQNNRTSLNGSMPKNNAGYYTSRSNSSKISSIKTGSGRTNSNNVYRTTSNYSSSSSSGNSVENLNVIDRMKIKFDDIDLSKISVSAQNATSGKFTNVNQDIWKNAQLNITKRDDGTYLIRNGDVPIGFTTLDGISSLFNSSKNESINVDSKNTIVGKLFEGNLKLSDINLDRISKTEDGAYNGKFTNINLASYNNSKLSYDVSDNGVVSIKNGDKIIGYTDIYGVPKLNNKSNYTSNMNASSFMDYVADTNVNLSLSNVSMKNIKDKYISDTTQGALENFYASNFENMDFDEGSKFVPYNLEKFLEEKGTTTEEFNNAIRAAVLQEGVGTREGVVAAVESLVKGLAQYDTKLPYVSSTGRSGIENGKYTGYGVADEWGKNGNYYSSAYNRTYNQTGLDCSGLVSWALHNGGYKYNSYASTSYGGPQEKSYENIGEKIPCSQYTGQAGDLLWHSGHVAMIVGVEDGKYMVAEESGGENGLVVKQYPTSGSSFSHVIKMDDYYSDESNLDLDNFFEN